jgi:MoaA/NifB/PqqE/SkfB family radical SAM enzyme
MFTQAGRYGRYLSQVPISNIERAFNTGTLLQLVFAVTYRCDSRCRMCNIWKVYQDKKELASKELTTADVARFFQDKGMHHLTDVYITGGEPFLRDDLSEIIGTIIRSNKRISVIIATNGMLPRKIARSTEDLAESFSHNDISIAVSLDGLDDVHDYMRGVEGAFKKACETISLLQSLRENHRNLRVGGSMTITEDNYTRIVPTWQFLNNMGVSEFSCRPMHVSEHFYQLKEATMIMDSEMIGTIEKQLNSLPKTAKSFFDQKTPTYLRSPDELIVPCFAGFHSAFLDPYGNVYPCIYYNYSLGNLKEKSFSEIWGSDTVKTCRSNIKSGRCPKCWSECVSWLSIRLDFKRYAAWLMRNFVRG